MVNNITVVAEEFFNGSPTAAIQSLKGVDARIIYALCYVNNCPKILCQAYEQGLYGPNIVWIFDTFFDPTRQDMPKPAGCTRQMIDEVAKSTLLIGADLEASVSDHKFQGQIGHSAAQVGKEITNNFPNATRKPFFSWGFMCYEMVQHSAFVIDRVEKQLNLQGETLSNFVGNSTKSSELEQIFRENVLDLEIDSIWGLSRQSETASSPNLYRHTTPSLVVIQIQPNLSKKLIFWVNESNHFEPFQQKKPIWRTFNSQPPRSELIIETINLTLPKSAIVIIQCLASLAVLSIGFTLIDLFKNRHSKGFVDSYKRMTMGTLVGCFFPLVALFTFPHPGSSMVPFCKSAPYLTALSLMLVTLCLTMKIFIKFFGSSCCNDSIGKHSKMKNNFTIPPIIAIIILGIIFTANEIGNGHLQPKIFYQTPPPTTNEILAKLSLYRYEACHSNDFTLGWIVVGASLALALFGILSSVLVRKRLTRLYMADFELTSIILYFFTSIVVVLLLALISIPGETVQFSILTIYSFVLTVTLVTSFHWWKCGKFVDKPPVETKPCNRRRRNTDFKPGH